MRTSFLLATISFLAFGAFADFTVADAAVRGEVTVVNVPHRFADGKIDWLYNATDERGAYNPEWTWQLNRMYFWNDLARAYELSKDERYAAAFARQLEGWLDQTGGIPPDSHYNDEGSPWRTIEEGLRLAGSWSDAWRVFRESPSFPEKLRKRFTDAMRAQANHLMRHRTHDNWLLIEMNGVHAFATLFPDFAESPALRRDAARIFGDEIRAQLLSDGLQHELSPDYHGVLVSVAAAFYRRAKATDSTRDLPPDFVRTFTRAVEGPIALMTPGFTEPCFNDTFTISVKRMLSGAVALLPPREDFLWAVSEGAKGSPPKGAVASRFFSKSGFAVMRSDWTTNATYLAFDVGPLGIAHSHQDKLSFTLWKGNEELVFDDGGGQYERSPERTYAVSGYDHNTLLVDGLAQYRTEPRRADTPIEAGWRSDAACDYAFGVYDQGFGRSQKPLAKHRREIMFFKNDDRFRITDTVTSLDGNPHDYMLLFHLDTTNVVISDNRRWAEARYGAGRRWGLSVACRDKRDRVTAVSGRGSPALAGWYIGRNNRTNHVATTLFVSAPREKNHTFITDLVILDANSGD